MTAKSDTNNNNITERERAPEEEGNQKKKKRGERCFEISRKSFRDAGFREIESKNESSSSSPTTVSQESYHSIKRPQKFFVLPTAAKTRQYPLIHFLLSLSLSLSVCCIVPAPDWQLWCKAAKLPKDYSLSINPSRPSCLTPSSPHWTSCCEIGVDVVL